MNPQLNSLIAVVFVATYLPGMIIWIYFLSRQDIRLRKWLGKRYGVTINLSGRGMWTVREANQGMKGCLIEMLQICFWIPAIFIPFTLCTGGVFLLFSVIQK